MVEGHIGIVVGERLLRMGSHGQDEDDEQGEQVTHSRGFSER